MKRFQIVLKILASVFATLLASCAYTPKAQFVETNSAEGTFVDTRDGQTYKTVTIGTQTWMAENLKYKVEDSYCYDDDESKCKYGRLYSWTSARDEKLCPVGWHIPFNEEWEVLRDAVGGEEVAGNRLKADKGWGDANGADVYKFTVRPSGYRSKGKYEGLYRQARFWINGDYSWLISKHVDRDFDSRGPGPFLLPHIGWLNSVLRNESCGTRVARAVLLFDKQSSKAEVKAWGLPFQTCKSLTPEEEEGKEHADDFMLSVRCISDYQEVSESEED